MKKQSGQVILGLILVMVVALGIGLSIVQRSLIDVSTSTKVEQSSRAFSAAEAGIEQAISGDTSGVDFSNNSRTIEVTDSDLIPCVPGASGCDKAVTQKQDALEYPPLAREEVAHVWLADFNSTSNPPPPFYTQPELDIYWGNSEEKTAIELTIVYYEANAYKSKKWFIDASDNENNFDKVSCTGGYVLRDDTYTCKVRLGDVVGYPSITGNGPLPANLMLIRARLLYNSISQPLAVQSTRICATGCAIPPQARIFTSTGVSGETQRKVRVFQVSKVVPPYFDFAIFSTGGIIK